MARNWKDVRAEAVAAGLIDETLDVLSDPESLARIGAARGELDRGEGLDAAALGDFLAAPSDQHDHIFKDEDGWLICVCECPECMTVDVAGAPHCICPRCGHNSGSGLPTYLAHVTRDGDWWMVHVPEIDGLTQASHLGEAEYMARGLIATTLDVEMDTFHVIIHEMGADQE